MPGGGGHDHGVEAFTRGVQSNIGMGLGVLAFSVAMGALLAVVFAWSTAERQRVGAAAVLYVAGGMLFAVVVPALKYPPNPPALSLDETIKQRTLLYLLMVVLSAALFVARGLPGSAAGTRLGRLERNAGRGAAPTSWPWPW